MPFHIHAFLHNKATGVERTYAYSWDPKKQNLSKHKRHIKRKAYRSDRLSSLHIPDGWDGSTSRPAHRAPHAIDEYPRDPVATARATTEDPITHHNQSNQISTTASVLGFHDASNSPTVSETGGGRIPSSKRPLVVRRSLYSRTTDLPGLCAQVGTSTTTLPPAYDESGDAPPPYSEAGDVPFSVLFPPPRGELGWWRAVSGDAMVWE